MHIKRGMHIKKWCMHLNKESIFLRRSYLRELAFDIIMSYVVAYNTLKCTTYCHFACVTTSIVRWSPLINFGVTDDPGFAPFAVNSVQSFFFHQFCSRRNTWHVTNKKGTCSSSRGTSVLLWFLVEYVMLSPQFIM